MRPGVTHHRKRCCKDQLVSSTAPTAAVSVLNSRCIWGCCVNGMYVQAGGATSSGPAAGSGLEIILQGFNWESYRNNWYQVSPAALQQQMQSLVRFQNSSNKGKLHALPPCCVSMLSCACVTRFVHHLMSSAGHVTIALQLLPDNMQALLTASAGQHAVYISTSHLGNVQCNRPEAPATCCCLHQHYIADMLHRTPSLTWYTH